MLPVRFRRYVKNEKQELVEFKKNWLKIEAAGACPEEKRQLVIDTEWIHWMVAVQSDRVANSQDVDDVASETLIRLCQKVEKGYFRYDPKKIAYQKDKDRDKALAESIGRDPFRGWWVVSIYRIVLDNVKPMSNVPVQLPHSFDAPYDIEYLTRIAIRDIFETPGLTTREKTCLTLRFLQSWTADEIADKLMCEPRTVRRAIASGKKKIRSAHAGETCSQ